MVWELVSQQFALGLAQVTENFVIGIASLIVVLAALVVGWLVGKILVRVLHAFLESIKLEHELKKRGVHDALMGFSVTTVLEKFVKLVTYAVFLGLVADIVHLGFLSQLVMWFIGYVPLLVQGATIIVIALLAADYVTDRIKASKVPFARTVGLALEVFVIYTAIVMALPLLLPNADVEILKTTFLLIVGSLSIALGLGMAIALGLGLKDTVADVAKRRKGEFEKII